MIRVLTGLALAAGAWAAIFLAPSFVLVLITTVLAVLALHEFFEIAAHHGIRPLRWVGHAAAVLWLLGPHLDRGFLVTLILVGLFVAGIMARIDVKEILASVSVTLTGVVYIAGALLCGLLLHEISGHWLAFVIVAGAIGDSVALAVGKTFGRHQLAPLASPHKTWEGTVGSLVGGTGVCVGYAHVFMAGECTLLEAAILALVVNVANQLGDMAESVIKRGAGVKDSSGLLPGHGGVLDRLDGLLFAMPVAYGYLHYLR